MYLLNAEYIYILVILVFLLLLSAVVELSFRKGRSQTDSMRALRTQIFATRAYEAFLSGSKGHFNIGSFDSV